MSLTKCWMGGLLCCIAGFAGNSVLAADAPVGSPQAQPAKSVPAQTVVAGFGQAVSASTLDRSNWPSPVPRRRRCSGPDRKSVV